MKGPLRTTIAALPWTIPLFCVVGPFFLNRLDHETRENWLVRLSFIALLLPVVIPWMTSHGAAACGLAGFFIFILGGIYSGDMGERDHFLTGAFLAASGIVCGFAGILTAWVQMRLVRWWKS
jgi:hypothetical protein